jgi:hypothetical protein
LQVSPVRYLRRAYLHLSYSIDFGFAVVVIQGTPLNLTAVCPITSLRLKVLFYFN